MPFTPDSGEWGPPVPPDEYRDRIRKTRAEMERRHIDTLLVTSPPNLTYLTGYDSIWYHVPTPTALALHLGSDEVLFFDSAGHTDLVPVVACLDVIDEIVYFGLDHAPEAEGDDAYTTPWVLASPVDSILRGLGGRGWLNGRVGIERWSRSPGAPVLAELEARFTTAGAKVLDASWCVDTVRMVKSPREVECMRRAAAIADAAMLAVRKEIRPGITEIEIQAFAEYEMAKLGGEPPAIRTAIRTGPRGASHHAPPTRRKVLPNELVWVDFSASYNRYHADLARTHATGDVDPRWHDLLATTSGSIPEIVKAVKPGDHMRRVQEVMDAYIDAMGLRKYAWWIGGYAMGIAIPPDWVGHVFFGGDGFEDMSFEPGMTLNLENVFDITKDDWRGGRGCSFIEMLLMTEAGIEVLSKVPRELYVVAN
jgi:Xaa-Pro aminopeptidase